MELVKSSAHVEITHVPYKGNAPAIQALMTGEVDMVFDVPLSFLMDPSNHARHTRELRGAWRTYHVMHYEEHYIWGVTAGILKNLYERMI